ncbi:MAG: phage repressor protein [Xanthobacteraceae bacterium]|nr:phage repressor protein [Xanthobacteraceae bacterium]
MILKDILARIEQRLRATGLSADAASKMADKPDAIRNMRRAVKAGRGGVNTGTVEALAGVLGTTAVWLLKAEGEETSADWRSEDVAHSIEKPRARTVRVKGYVGAGDAAHFYKVSDEAFEEVAAPDGATDQTVAVEIRGTSWGRFMNTWLVFYDDVRSPITEDLLGQPCVIGLADDRILIKVIKRDGNGGYRLVSNNPNEPDIDHAEIEWAAKVTSMRPR